MKRLLTLIVLVIMSFSVGLYMYADSNPTSLLFFHENMPMPTSPLIVDEPVRGEFVAVENNLALMRFRVENFGRNNSSHITFKLRPKGDKQWAFTSESEAKNLVGGLLFPIGFPPVARSKGNTYEFELSSSDGTLGNAVALGGGYHGVASQYVFGKSELARDRSLLFWFVQRKIVSVLMDPYAILYVSFVMAPIGMYVLPQFSLLLIGWMYMVYAYLPVSLHSNTVLFIACMGLFALHMKTSKAAIAFWGAFLCLIQIPIAIGLSYEVAAIRLATLVFFSLVAGGIMAIRELKK